MKSLSGRCLQFARVVGFLMWTKTAQNFTHPLEGAPVHSIFHKSYVKLLYSTVFRNNKEIKMTF